MQQIIYTFLNYINNSIYEDTYYHIAVTILHNLHRISSSSLEQTADLCDVSKATINRFCHQIGYDNYSTFRKVMRGYKRKTIIEDKTTSDFMTHNIKIIIENMKSINQTNLFKIDSALGCLYHSNRCLLIGYGSFQNYALDFQKSLLNCGKLIEVYMDINRQMKEMNHLNENDVVIITSLHGHHLHNETFHILDIIKRQKCKVILITQLTDEYYLNNFDYVIPCGTQTDAFTSKYAIIYLYDLLADRYRQIYSPVIVE